MSSGSGVGKKIVVVMNPASGSSNDDFRSRVEEALRQHGANFELRETTPKQTGVTIARQARAEGVRHVIACGGDGTVMAVVNGLGANEEGSESVTLSIVPGGTANLVAAALKIPNDPKEALDVALNGMERDIDLGKRNDTLFALGIGVGLTERMVSEATENAKEKLGRWAYLFALLKEIGARPQQFHLKLDGKQERECRGVAVVIANAGELGNGMCFAPDAKLDDGLLDVCVVHRFQLSDLLRLVGGLVFRGLKKDRALTYYQANRVELDVHPPLEVQIDGEVVEARTPVTAEVVLKGLRVTVSRDTK